MNRMAVAIPTGFGAGALVGLLIGGLWLQWQLGTDLNAGHPFILLTEFPGVRVAGQAPWRGAWLIVLASACSLALAGAAFSIAHRLTSYGLAHFQSRAEIRRHGLLQPVGAGLVFGKLGKPGKKGRYISGSYDQFPHALVIAPTRSGKGVGYVIPNTLLFPGSCVIMDVKGEIFEATARHRQAQGDKVFRFAPFDFENPSHCYNPLERIAAITNTDQRFTELGKLASYFLATSSGGGAADFITAGRSLFVAAGMLAIERGRPTIGEIARILFASGNKEEAYAQAAREVRHREASTIFLNFSGYSDRTLSSYASVLDGAGLGLWLNPRIDKVTSVNDFSWDDIRRAPHAVYIVANSDDIPTLAPLLRLLFGELIATMRARVPDPATEPWPVQMILDEFDQLGPMPIIVQALKQLAGHGARVSIITQSVPGLEATPYSENERLAIESAAGIKLYIAPNEKKTASEVSEALGKTTKLSVSDSYSRDGQGLLKRSVSRRNEERPLLTPDELRRLSPDKIILIPERQNPIMVDRIVYWQDPFFTAITEAQKGPLPWPDPIRRELAELRAEVAGLREGRLSYPPAPAADAKTPPPPVQKRSLAREVVEERGAGDARSDDEVMNEIAQGVEAIKARTGGFNKRLAAKVKG